MLFFQLSLQLFLLGCGSSSASKVSHELKIMGGHEFQNNNPLYRSAVLIQYLSEGAPEICTGILIKKNWILTAGHCRGDSYEVLTYAKGSILNQKSRRKADRVDLTDHVITVEDLKASNYQTPLSDVMLLKIDSPDTSDENILPVNLAESDGVLADKNRKFLIFGAGAHDGNVNIKHVLHWKSINGLEYFPQLNLVSARSHVINLGDSGGGLFIEKPDGSFEILAILSGTADFRARWTALKPFAEKVKLQLGFESF